MADRQRLDVPRGRTRSIGNFLRLNPDGSAPSDNPFFAAGAAMDGEVGENVQKIA